MMRIFLSANTSIDSSVLICSKAFSSTKRLVTELYCYRELKDSGRIKKAIGSLGGGNHFIELDKDDATAHLRVYVH